MAESGYLVGIDLGTTNTVAAYARLPEGGTLTPVRLFDVEQLVAPGEIAARTQLPSLRYHPAPGELQEGDLVLPWSGGTAETQSGTVIGELAQRLGAQVPGRLVASAKSWLSHRSVDRTAAVLPWGAGADVAKVSPIEASASYLQYLRAAWHHRFPGYPLEHQEVVLTVPGRLPWRRRAWRASPGLTSWKSRRLPSTTGCSSIATSWGKPWKGFAWSWSATWVAAPRISP